MGHRILTNENVAVIDLENEIMNLHCYKHVWIGS